MSRNQLLITGSIQERGVERYTPAGLPAFDLVLHHEGQSEEAGGWRKVMLEMRAVVLGPLAREMMKLPLGESLECSGFVAASRNGKGVVFHITGYTVVSLNHTTSIQD